MKKVIRGKTYNTKTAKEIQMDDSGNVPQSDFRFFTETLYLKKTGEYFLAGEGHAMTKYAKTCSDGNSRTYGRKIIPLTTKQAELWQKIGAKEYDDNFSWYEHGEE